MVLGSVSVVFEFRKPTASCLEKRVVVLSAEHQRDDLPLNGCKHLVMYYLQTQV